MVSLIIDNKKVVVPREITILEAARIAGIEIPTLCYLKDINEIGACRVCLVEIEGINKLAAACNTPISEGMVIKTNSPRVRKARKINVELILSQHNFRCATCTRNGSCRLQSISRDLGINYLPYKEEVKYKPWRRDFPLIRDNEKCIKCMRCVQVCNKVQSLGVWDTTGSGSRTNIGVYKNNRIEDTDCSLCGQCITHCPVGALVERDDTEKVFEALADPEIITVVQIAPAVRGAWGEEIGLSREEATVGKIVDALRRIGFDYVFDTTFAADLTIMEEGTELIEKLRNGDKPPMFTSCCPGWVRFIKSQYPEYVSKLSTAKSPQQMFGAITKTYFAEKMNIDPRKIYCISIMPCTAKKYEKDIAGINGSDADRDVDVVLTTRELVKMIRAEHINAKDLKDENMDNILGDGTGAGVIFGATGGVMEAALRSAYYLLTGENPKADSFRNVRGMNGWKEAEFAIGSTILKVAVASGLGNARNLMDAIERDEVKYDFVEIMACPGGCSGGGGQPIFYNQELAEDRADVLYGLDRNSKWRFSHENPMVIKCYNEYLGEPLSKKAHELLHFSHIGSH